MVEVVAGVKTGTCITSVITIGLAIKTKGSSMIALKLTQIGNSVGVVLPKDALLRLGVEKGDVVYLTEVQGGDMRLSAYSPEVAEEVAAGEAFMDEYRDTFRALAK